MKVFVYSIVIVGLATNLSFAQLLGGTAAKPADNADGKAQPRPGADAKAGVAGNAGAKPAAAPQANAMFAVIDVDGDGIISKIELRKAVRALQSLDADKDGSITMAEASVGSANVVAGVAAGFDPQIDQFMANDRNNDGKLTPNEVPREMLPMLQGVDRDGDGAIDRAELQAAMANTRNQFGGRWNNSAAGGGLNNAQQATGQFLQYDRDGNGRLTPNELPQQASRMLQGADSNGDGAIDAGELQAAIAQQGGRARGLRGGVSPDDLKDRKTPGGRRLNDKN